MDDEYEVDDKILMVMIMMIMMMIEKQEQVNNMYITISIKSTTCVLTAIGVSDIHMNFPQSYVWLIHSKIAKCTHCLSLLVLRIPYTLVETVTRLQLPERRLYVLGRKERQRHQSTYVVENS